MRSTLIILAGGKGSRLQSLEPNRPKPMILVGGKPFLRWLVEHYYATLGYRSFIVSTGHLAEVIESYEWARHFSEATFEFAREATPLGTGGAVAAIFAGRALDRAWVINGDTFLPAPLPDVAPRFEALFTTLEPGQVFDAQPNLVVEGDFVLREDRDGQLFDAGAIYVTSAAVGRHSGAPPFSIQQLLSEAMTARKVGHATVPGTCYDIGTPGRYQRFEAYLKSCTRQ